MTPSRMFVFVQNTLGPKYVKQLLGDSSTDQKGATRERDASRSGTQARPVATATPAIFEPCTYNVEHCRALGAAGVENR